MLCYRLQVVFLVWQLKNPSLAAVRECSTGSSTGWGSSGSSERDWLSEWTAAGAGDSGQDWITVSDTLTSQLYFTPGTWNLYFNRVKTLLSSPRWRWILKNVLKIHPVLGKRTKLWMLMCFFSHDKTFLRFNAVFCGLIHICMQARCFPCVSGMLLHVGHTVTKSQWDFNTVIR